MVSTTEIYVLTVLEARGSKIKVLAYLVSGESSLFGLQRAMLSPCPGMAFHWYAYGDRELIRTPVLLDPSLP